MPYERPALLLPVLLDGVSFLQTALGRVAAGKQRQKAGEGPQKRLPPEPAVAPVRAAIPPTRVRHQCAARLAHSRSPWWGMYLLRLWFHAPRMVRFLVRCRPPCPRERYCGNAFISA
jgi:hypothetical protein